MNGKVFCLTPLALAFLMAGCAGSGTNSPNGPGVRVVNGLRTVPQANVSSGTIVVGSSLVYGAATGTPKNPYTIIPIGPQTLTLANAATPATVVDSTTLNITTAQDVTAIAYNPSSPTFLQLFDSLLIPTNSGIRFANASTVAGSVDLFLTPYPPTTGSSVGPINLTVGSVYPTQSTPGAGAYFGINSYGQYILKVYPAGADSGTPLIQQTVSIPQAVSWTFILLDPPSGAGAPVVLQLQDNRLHDSAP